ncbi:preprotein translocase subunit SecE [bacterium]|jgi:preprotein translocase subunit SecE|nr:preprotein translocase subunit SecE [bacterium]
MKKLFNYLKKSREELGKVSWPSRQTTINHTGIVLAISVAVAIFLGGIDYILNKILQLFI